jgi:hypothetical protein
LLLGGLRLGRLLLRALRFLLLAALGLPGLLRPRLSVAGPWLLPARLVAASRTAAALFARAALLFSRRLAHPLFELADFFLHVAARLRVLLRTDFVVAAVRAALPAFGVGALAARTED